MFYLMRVFWGVSLFLVASCAELIQPNLKTDISEFKQGDYSLDPEHAALLFKVEHMGFSKFVGRFNRFDAQLNFDAENIENSFMNAIIEMDSLDIPNEVFARDIMGSDWLDAQTHPKAHFKTTSVIDYDENKIEFMGELTFLGVTKPVPLYVIFNGAARNLLTQKYTLGFSATATFKRSEFGLDKYIPLISDEVEIEVYAEFQRK